MAVIEVWSHRLWLVVALTCCLVIEVKSTREQARNYQNFLNNVRSLVSHPYRDSTAVARGGTAVSFVPLTPLASGATTVELIVSHRDLYTLGYRTVQNGQRVVYLFSDVNVETLPHDSYNRYVLLNYGGSYSQLEAYADQTRQETRVTAFTLRDGIALLGRVPNQNTERARARVMLSLVMVVSEALRFNEIGNGVREHLSNSVTWSPSTRDIGLMNSWDGLSTFVTRTSMDVGAPSSQYFPALNQDVTLRIALALMAVMARCFHKVNRNRRQTIPLECSIGSGVDAALADGVNDVYFFNGPNFVHVHFTPGTTNDKIVGGVKSIYNDWAFLRNTPFVDGFDAGFRVPNSGNAYIFKGKWYALIDIPRMRIINGPKTIYDSWPSLRPTTFVNGVDAVFASVRKNEIYMFSGSQYALVNYAPGTKNDRIVNGPKSISSSWASLRNTLFVYGFDAAFARPDKTEAYLFKVDQYVLIDYAPGTTKDRIINGPLKIRDGWPSLRNTAFDISQSPPTSE